MLNTQPSIIYFAQTDKELVITFTSTLPNIAELNISLQDSELQYGIESLVTLTIPYSSKAGDTIIAYSSESGINYTITENGIDITPAQVVVPAINIGSLQVRKQKVELMFQYLAVNVTTANYQSFNTSFRDNITYYERGLDLLQAAITASAAGYLNGANVQRKSDLINILN